MLEKKYIALLLACLLPVAFFIIQEFNLPMTEDKNSVNLNPTKKQELPATDSIAQSPDEIENQALSNSPTHEPYYSEEGNEEDSEVVNVGEFIDVDNPQLYEQNDPNTETVNVGEFIDLDNPSLPNDDTVDGSVVNIGEFIDADNTLPSFETDDGKVENIGRELDIDNPNDSEISADDSSETVNIGEFIPIEN